MARDGRRVGNLIHGPIMSGIYVHEVHGRGFVGKR